MGPPPADSERLAGPHTSPGWSPGTPGLLTRPPAPPASGPHVYCAALDLLAASRGLSLTQESVCVLLAADKQAGEGAEWRQSSRPVGEMCQGTAQRSGESKWVRGALEWCKALG